MTVHTGQTTTTTLAQQVAVTIRRHQAGDADAMAALFRLTRPWIYKIGLACGLSPCSADDVVQSTIAAVLTHLPSLRDPAAGLAWLTAIARREAIRVHREERRVDPLADHDAPGADSADPEGIALTNLAREALMRALAQLPDKQRKLLTFLFLDDMRDYASVAHMLGMPVGSIGPTRQRGLRKVRALLDRGGAELHPRCA